MCSNSNVSISHACFPLLHFHGPDVMTRLAPFLEWKLEISSESLCAFIQRLNHSFGKHTMISIHQHPAVSIKIMEVIQ